MDGTDPTANGARSRRAEPAGALHVIGAAAARIHGQAIAAEGRRRTRQVLKELTSEGWRVFHDCTLSGGERIDHLLAGPGGIYLLESRAWHGIVTVDLKGATITPQQDPTAAWTARGQHRLLPAATAAVVRALSARGQGSCPAIRAVVVVWAPFPEGVALSGRITYVAGDRLGSWLRNQPNDPVGGGTMGTHAEPVPEVRPQMSRSTVFTGSAEH